MNRIKLIPFAIKNNGRFADIVALRVGDAGECDNQECQGQEACEEASEYDDKNPPYNAFTFGLGVVWFYLVPGSVDAGFYEFHGA